MSELGNINIWRLKDTVEFGDPNSEKVLANGNRIPDFKPLFSRHCARFRESWQYTATQEGEHNTETLRVAVRHFPNVDYTIYNARYKGKIYEVTNVLPDYSKVVTFDLITLRLVKKYG